MLKSRVADLIKTERLNLELSAVVHRTHKSQVSHVVVYCCKIRLSNTVAGHEFV